MAKDEKTAPEPVMTAFVLGETSFASRGMSHIKVTEGGKSRILPIPIKSIGLADIMEEMDRNAPKPPVIMKKIYRESEEGRQMGLLKDQVVRVHDHTDAAYLEELSVWSEKRAWSLLVLGLDVEFSDKGGNGVTDPDAIVAGLKKAGITGHQRDRIVKDISALTRITEEEADFLSGNASG